MTDEQFSGLCAALYRQRQASASPAVRARVDAQRDALRREWRAGFADADLVDRLCILRRIAPLPTDDTIEIVFELPAGSIGCDDSGATRAIHPDGPPLVCKVGGSR